VEAEAQAMSTPFLKKNVSSLTGPFRGAAESDKPQVAGQRLSGPAAASPADTFP